MPTQAEIEGAKRAIDKVIGKGRVHLYKPIQIAEILHRSRTIGRIDTSTLEDYRVPSRHWRDEVSMRLVGNVSTSSARYQDDVFNENAVPPWLLKILDDVNKAENGMVENYIYQRCCQTWGVLANLYGYLDAATAQDFSLRSFMSRFEEKPGLKRSIDKAYEITVYALFRALTKVLQVEVTLAVRQPDKQLLADFSDFIEKVVGIPAPMDQTVFSAELYRLGVTHAADVGIDVLTNFGAAIQVKHVTLHPDLVESAAEPVDTARLVIVCLEPEKAGIEAVLSQVGIRERIQGIVTDGDLERWYAIAFEKYRSTLGEPMLSGLKLEFRREFPLAGELVPFMIERGYRREDLGGIWKLD